ncbi:WYL domain-containing protein [Pseudomonas sp. PhalM4]
MEFIDYRLCWNRHITRKNICDFFGVSLDRASRDLTEYEKLAPANFSYDLTTKQYRATDSFQAIFANSSTQQHLDNLVRAVIQPERCTQSYFAGHSAVAVAPLPKRKVNSEVIGVVLGSIRSYQSLQITYRCLDNPDGVELEVTPHAVIQDGNRWLARCWCSTRGEFESFDLSRIVRAAVVGPDLDRGGLDRAWERMVKVIITPNPELTAAQRRLVEDDYGMVDRELQIECRRALLSSMLRQLNLLGGQCGLDDEPTLLAVKNWDQVRPLIVL